MRSGRLAAFALALAASGCGGGGKSLPTSNPPNGASLPPISGANVLPLTIDGATCSTGSYANKPCVSVTVCAPGSSTNCQTINDVLLDTGSFGFRVFKSVLGAGVLSGLVPVMSGGSAVAECVQFGDGSSDWGPVETAGIVLGGEPAVTVPIQVIDSTYASVPAGCGRPDVDPAHAGFNAILGVGLFAQDCGRGCATAANNHVYFGCNGTSCSGVTVGLPSQVQNPVALLPKDNNGVVLELPIIPLGGAPSLNGYLVLGIGTGSNNSPSGVMTFGADPNTGNYSATIGGTSVSAFLDSGSNGLYFPAPPGSGLSDCAALDPTQAGWFCPSSPVSLTATGSGSSGNPQSLIPFQVGNMVALSATHNKVFIEIGADGNFGGTEYLDWGLPFYIGRNVYFGIEGMPSSLGTGPYWAY